MRSLVPWKNRRVTILGLGRHGGGVAAAQYVAAGGAQVTISDTASAEVLSESLKALEGIPLVRVTTGGHAAEDLRAADVVVVNPAVPPDSPWVKQAQQRGATITTEIELFIDACPAMLVGVTGTNGKSTTAAMLARALQQDGRKCWLGGNLGGSLLADLPRMNSTDIVVLELSSFQLARLRNTPGRFQLGLVTGCTPNHLDWHGDWKSYVAAKQRLITQVAREGNLVLAEDDAEVRGWRRLAAARIVSLIEPTAVPPLRVPGPHNERNARLAATAALALGCAPSAIATGLQSFSGLPHRLENLGDWAGRTAINDSMATTPESVVAALKTFDQPVWLLAGGKDKGANLRPLVTAAADRIQGACFYGDTGPLLARIAPPGDPRFACTETLAEAVRWCWQRSTPGDAILLSPGCSSLDQFRDYRHRAEVFAQCVAANATTPNEPTGVQSG